MVVFIGLIFYQMSANQAVLDTGNILNHTRKTEKLFIDAETGFRGFLLTGQEAFLSPYNDSLGRIPESLEKLHSLIDFRPIQRERVSAIETTFSQWHDYAEEAIEVKRAKKDISAFVGKGRGRALMDKIRLQFDQVIAEEESRRFERSEDNKTKTYYLLLIVVVMSVSIGAGVAWLGRQQLLDLSQNYQETLKKEKTQNELLTKEQWLKSQLAGLSEVMVGERKLDDLCDSILANLAKTLKFNVGAFYVLSDRDTLERRGGYAGSEEFKGFKEKIQLGEGLVGQSAKENQIVHLTEVPPDYIKISSALGDTVPNHLIIYPIESDGRVNAVIELGFYSTDSDHVLHFLGEAMDSIGYSIKAARYRERLEILLREVREQAKSLQAQQEELRVSNEELEEQTRLQRESQARLEAQHAELEQTNSQLEAQSRILEIQKEDLNVKNDELEMIRLSLEQKTKELQQSSRYKSEFLANMSHELRTPLNSSLILAKLLADNKEGNLSEKQVEFSQQILSSGNDLLMLINDILDLSKVESGKLEITPEEFAIEDMLGSLEKMFTPISKQKGVGLVVDKDAELPELLYSDRLRVEQILKNLLSNAFKFTSQGTVTLRAKKSKTGGIDFTVIDTGIGIKESQQSIIFEAFRQADGTTNRKFGGTGLGLSISKDLAKLLEGQLTLTSEENVGSQFNLELPLRMTGQKIESSKHRESPLEVYRPSPPVQVSASASDVKVKPVGENTLKDDRASIGVSDRTILIIEDDFKFANILLELVREQGFKCLAATTAEQGVSLAVAHSPDAILLDIGLPDHSGLVVLDQLKTNAQTRHIPIHVVSAGDRSEQALQMGAIGYLVKPVAREDLMKVLEGLEERIQKAFRDVLIVEDDEVQRKAIRELIEEKDVRIHGVGTGKEAIQQLKEKPFDCVIIDINLPDISGFDLIDEMAELSGISHPPIIVYTGRDLTKDEEMRLKRHSQSVIIKGARSPERLLNEVTLFLHQVESRLSPKRKKILQELRNREKIFEDKKIMIVDDDVRNIFALTSALEAKGAQILMARNGQEAVDSLKNGNTPNLILMDIMMPVMDGYEATSQIRQMKGFASTPIIALTAKAMADDRAKCLDAGASDYLTKPVDLDKLLSLMRVWLSQAGGAHRDIFRPL